jgi:hypothetical protein
MAKKSNGTLTSFYRSVQAGPQRPTDPYSLKFIQEAHARNVGKQPKPIEEYAKEQARFKENREGGRKIQLTGKDKAKYEIDVDTFDPDRAEILASNFTEKQLEAAAPKDKKPILVKGVDGGTYKINPLLFADDEIPAYKELLSPEVFQWAMNEIHGIPQPTDKPTMDKLREMRAGLGAAEAMGEPRRGGGVPRPDAVATTGAAAKSTAIERTWNALDVGFDLITKAFEEAQVAPLGALGGPFALAGVAAGVGDVRVRNVIEAASGAEQGTIPPMFNEGVLKETFDYLTDRSDIKPTLFDKQLYREDEKGLAHVSTAMNIGMEQGNKAMITFGLVSGLVDPIAPVIAGYRGVRFAGKVLKASHLYGGSSIRALNAGEPLSVVAAMRRIKRFDNAVQGALKLSIRKNIMDVDPETLANKIDEVLERPTVGKAERAAEDIAPPVKAEKPELRQQVINNEVKAGPGVVDDVVTRADAERATNLQVLREVDAVMEEAYRMFPDELIQAERGQTRSGGVVEDVVYKTPEKRKSTGVKPKEAVAEQRAEPLYRETVESQYLVEQGEMNTGWDIDIKTGETRANETEIFRHGTAKKTELSPEIVDPINLKGIKKYFNLHGPGFYTTRNQGIAGKYAANHEDGGKVYEVVIKPKKTLDLDEKLNDDLVKQVMNAILKPDPESGDIAFRLNDDIIVTMQNFGMNREITNGNFLAIVRHELVKAADEHYGRAWFTKKYDNVNDTLVSLGYDTMKHEGGNIRGGGKIKHDVMIAIKPKSKNIKWENPIVSISEAPTRASKAFDISENIVERPGGVVEYVFGINGRMDIAPETRQAVEEGIMKFHSGPSITLSTLRKVGEGAGWLYDLTFETISKYIWKPGVRALTGGRVPDGFYNWGKAQRKAFIDSNLGTGNDYDKWIQRLVAPSEFRGKSVAEAMVGINRDERIIREIIDPLITAAVNDEAARKAFMAANGEIPVEQLNVLEKGLYDNFVVLREKFTDEGLKQFILTPNMIRENYIRNYYDYTKMSLLDAMRQRKAFEMDMGYTIRRKNVLTHEQAAKIKNYVAFRQSFPKDFNGSIIDDMAREIAETDQLSFATKTRAAHEYKRVKNTSIEDAKNFVDNLYMRSRKKERKVSAAAAAKKSTGTKKTKPQEPRVRGFDIPDEEMRKKIDKAIKNKSSFWERGTYITPDWKEEHLIKDIRAGYHGLRQLGYDAVRAKHMRHIFNDPEVNPIAGIWGDLFPDIELNTETVNRFLNPEFERQLVKMERYASKETAGQIDGYLKAIQKLKEQRRALELDPTYALIPDQLKYGPMRNTYVKKHVYNDLRSINNAPDIGANLANTLDKIGVTEAYKQWKASKTVWNPATHARNIMWNAYATFMFADVNPVDFALWGDTTRQILNKNSDLFKSMTDTGVFKTGFAEADLTTFARSMQNSLEGQKTVKGGSGWAAAIKAKVSPLNFAKRAYGGEENYFKALVFNSEIHKAGGWDVVRKQLADGDYTAINEAAQKANKYLFDYSDKSPILQAFTKTPLFGSPFATFYAKFIPMFAEEVAKRPHRALLPYGIAAGMIYQAKKKYGDETVEKSKNALPEWVKQSVPLSGEYGDPDSIVWWDWTNILPYMDALDLPFRQEKKFVEGALEGRLDYSPGASIREKLEYSVSSKNPLSPLGAPIPRTVYDISANKDFAGRPIRTTEGVASDRQTMDYILRMLLPSIYPEAIGEPGAPGPLGDLPGPGGYGAKRIESARWGLEDPATGMDRDITQARIKTYGGIDLQRTNVQRAEAFKVKEIIKKIDETVRAIRSVEMKRRSTGDAYADFRRKQLDRELVQWQKELEELNEANQ